MNPPKKKHNMTSLKFNSRQKYEMYVVFMNNKSETSCVPSFSSISHLLVWTVLVFCISTDLSAPKLWINPLCWTFYCLTSVCLSVRVSGSIQFTVAAMLTGIIRNDVIHMCYMWGYLHSRHFDSHSRESTGGIDSDSACLSRKRLNWEHKKKTKIN